MSHEPTGPLVPDLYRRLEERFGAVITANQGEAMVIHERGKITGPRRAGGGDTETRPTIAHPGEYYRVCCPKCHDTRFRLFINHRAVEFPWLIHCFNEGCYDSTQNRDQLIFFLYKTRRPRAPRALPGRTDGGTLRRVELPGTVVRLDALPRTHPANEYLGDQRGYDPWEIGREYGVGYCEYSARYPQCTNKLIIPVVMDGDLVGWQARFVGERNWKASASPKYWDMPGMSKRLMLYNFDRAKTFPWAGLQEGVTDVWSTGPMMMSLLGSTITFPQLRRLTFPFRTKPLVVMLDGDAQEANRAVTESLRKTHPGGLVTVELPPDTDPGDLDPARNLDLIRRAAAQQGVRLPD